MLIRFALCLMVSLAWAEAARPAGLPDPDGKPADLTKPVKVFILMGQSNMLGAGKIAGADKEGTLEHATKTAGLYPYLIDEAGNWTTRNDVRNVRVMVGKGGMDVHANDWLFPQGKTIGPEMGIGHQLGHLLDEPVLLLKVANAKKMLAELDTYYPGAKRYEVVGFFWWQGDKDRYDDGLATHYEQNLVHLIKTLRKDFDAPDAPFVLATLGQTKKGDGGNAQTSMNVGEAMGAAMAKLLRASR